MNYDLATIGNHDIEAGHKVYDKIVKEYNFPILAANAIDSKTGDPYFNPYTIVKKKGVKIAFLGLITPGIPNWLPENLYEGIFFDDMVKTAEKWVPIIQEKEKPDVLVGLFHAGYDHTYGGAKEESMNENASVLVAEQVKGFDIIMIGHDHRKYNEWLVNEFGDSVLILDARSSANNVAVANIEFKRNGKEYSKSITGEIITISDYKSDEDFDNYFTNEFNAIEEYVNRPLGEFTNEIYSQSSILGPSIFTDFINNVQLELSDADLSFTAPLSRSAVIKEGEIYVRDLFKLYKFENFLYTMELSGKEIDDYLEYNYSNWFDSKSSGHVVKFKKDKKGKVLINDRGYPSTAVNYYNYDVATGRIG